MCGPASVLSELLTPPALVCCRCDLRSRSAFGTAIGRGAKIVATDEAEPLAPQGLVQNISRLEVYLRTTGSASVWLCGAYPATFLRRLNMPRRSSITLLILAALATPGILCAAPIRSLVDRPDDWYRSEEGKRNIDNVMTWQGHGPMG